MDKAQKKIEAVKILERKDLSNEQKLFVISQLYNEDLSIQFPQLNYALLEWKDSHLKELWSKEVVDILENFNIG